MIFDKLFKKDKVPVAEKPAEQPTKVDYYAEGVAQFNAGHYTQAIEYFQVAVSEKSQSESSHLKLAESLTKLGKNKEAESVLYNLLAINPSSQSAHDMLAEIKHSIAQEIAAEQKRAKIRETIEQMKFTIEESTEKEPEHYSPDTPYDPHLDLNDYKIPNLDLMTDSDGFKQLLQSNEFQQSSAKIPIAMGIGDDGKPIIEDLTKMPHLLIAGMTNYGGPTFLNGLLLSILFKNHPSDVRLVLMGDKRLQLTSWSQLEKHFLTTVEGHKETPVVDDSKNALRVFKSLGIEMDARFALLKAAKVRKFDEYNELFCQRILNPQFGHRYLPRIVIVAFEANGLLNKETEAEICHLALMAHTVGIHLMLLTNQPIIYTPDIQTSISSRLAFKVGRLAESNAILGGSGAQNLRQIGEAIYSSPFEGAKHIQCLSISDNDIDNVISFINKQRAFSVKIVLPKYYFEDEKIPFNTTQKDEFFNDAARLVVASQFGSTSLLQRKLSLGYNRAGRIIDQLEAAGIVGPYDGSRARVVLIHDEATLEQLLRHL